MSTRTLGVPGKLIGGTKGSHILLEHPELVKSLKGRMIYFEADDGRICLVYDFLGLALVGSTDIKADDPGHGALRGGRDRLFHRKPALASAVLGLRSQPDRLCL